MCGSVIQSNAHCAIPFVDGLSVRDSLDVLRRGFIPYNSLDDAKAAFRTALASPPSPTCHWYQQSG
jgi:hypothetical protein